jgi:hypothetical protein
MSQGVFWMVCKNILMVCFHFHGELDAGVYGVQLDKKDEMGGARSTHRRDENYVYQKTCMEETIWKTCM